MKRVLTVVCGLLLFTAVLCAESTAPVIIDYFFEPGCPDCLKVNGRIIPELQERYEGFYEIRKHDTGLKQSIVLLAAYQEKLKVKENKPVSMFVDFTYALNGYKQIEEGLFERIDAAVEDRMQDNWVPPEEISVKDPEKLIDSRLGKFTLPVVLMNGFADGINPCAIGALIFFISLLSVSKVRGRGLLLMGTAFCIASFVTYTAIGFGLLRCLHLLAGFEWIRFALEFLMILVLGVLAVLSFRDAARYKHTGKPGDLTLQLPDTLKKKIHKIMKSGLGMGSLFLGGIVIGTTVTAIETVCTGQMYVPTLVLLIVRGERMSEAWTYLLLYNLMFILPLVIVFIMTFFGLKTETLLGWSKKNVVFSKVLLGLFFVLMAVMISCF